MEIGTTERNFGSEIKVPFVLLYCVSITTLAHTTQTGVKHSYESDCR